MDAPDPAAADTGYPVALEEIYDQEIEKLCQDIYKRDKHLVEARIAKLKNEMRLAAN